MRTATRSLIGARLVGAAGLVAVILVVESLIRLAIINPFIVPLPSEILLSFGRVITEEQVLSRFMLTAGEALGAGILVTIVGVPLGILLQRVTNLRAAFETWVAAFAAAPVVLAYPLFLVIFGRSAVTITMIGFVAGLAPVILKTIEGLAGVRPVLLRVGDSFKLTPWQRFWTIVFPAAVPDHLHRAAPRAHLRAHQRRRRRVPDQFRRARAAHQRPCRTLRSAGHLCGDRVRHPGQRRLLRRRAEDREMAASGHVTTAPASRPWLGRVALLRIGFVLALLVVWEALAASGLLYQDVVPSIRKIAAALVAVLADPAVLPQSRRHRLRGRLRARDRRRGRPRRRHPDRRQPLPRGGASSITSTISGRRRRSSSSRS